MQLKATIILSALAVVVAAHDGHDSTIPHTTTAPVPVKTSSDWCWSDTETETSTYLTYKPTGGYNSTYPGKTTLYTETGPAPTKPAPSTTATSPPVATGAAAKSQFGLAVLGLGLAAGLVL